VSTSPSTAKAAQRHALPPTEPKTFELRAFQRCRLEPMYTSVVLQYGEGETLRTAEGHAYDVSEGGARVEVDAPIEVGTRVSICLQLPGETSGVFASGRVVWMHDEADDPGPRRMAVRFTRFLTPLDQARLVRFIGSGLHRLVA
jgi:hypothetical protein